MQLCLGLTGADIVMDIRDIVYDFHKWEWSFEHVGQTGFDVLSVVPLIGALKYGDEVVDLVKGVDKTSDVVKNVDRTTDVIKGTSKVGFKYNMVENPGPLADILGNPASNFAGGKYNTTVLDEDMILYRAGKSGGGKNSLGNGLQKLLLNQQ